MCRAIFGQERGDVVQVARARGGVGHAANHTCDHSAHIGVDDGYVLLIGEAGDGTRGVGADTGQRQEGLDVAGDFVAVLGGKRQAELPDVPTFAELGLPGFEDMPYYGFYAPRGTPQKAIDTFSAAVAEVLALPAVREQLTHMGLTVGHMNPAQLAAREQAYTQVWRKIIQTSGFQPQ